jgi:uncharacterized membrane protein YkoI
MRKLVSILVGVTLLVPMSGAAFAQSAAHPNRDDQGQARKAVRDGNVRSLREIEQSVLPRMKGAQYLGPEYDSAAMAYRLKFIRDGRVTFVDIDARTGRILGISR